MLTDRHLLRRATATLGVAGLAVTVATASSPAAAAPARPSLCADIGVTHRGTNGADHLVGTDGDDVILGLGGDDLIEGLGGNDVICGGHGNDRIDAGAGDDVVTQGSFAESGPGVDPAALDIVALGTGNDAFFGFRDGSSFVDGGAGADWITGSPAFDLLAGGAGNDDLTNPSSLATPYDMTFGGDGNDRIRGGAGRDYVDGGAGDDAITGASGSGAPHWTGPAAPFDAAATSILLRSHVPSFASSPIPPGHLDLAVINAVADSDGDVTGDEPGAQRSGAVATSTMSGPFGPVDVSTNVATAPPSESNEGVLLPIDFSPYLTTEVADTTAVANWISDTVCPSAAAPLSLAAQTLADFRVGDDGSGRSLVDVAPDPADGADHVEATTSLPEAAGDARVVQATTTVDLHAVRILQGVGDPGTSIDVTVLQDPAYTATASGRPGGAAVTGTDAVVEVAVAGSPTFQLTGGDDPVVAPLIGVRLSAILGALSPLLDDLTPIVRLSMPVAKTATDDGTSASVTATLLQVEILPPALDGLIAPLRDLLVTILGSLGLSPTEPLATVDLGPMSADVNAPAGGIDCGTAEPGDMLLGGDGADTIHGGFGADFVIAGAGDDVVHGSGGGDLVVGDAGNDILLGQDGGDVLFGGADADALDGGSGVDWCDSGDGDDAADLACELPQAP